MEGFFGMKKTTIIYGLVCLIPLAVICAGFSWAVKKHQRFVNSKHIKGQIIELKINRLDQVLDKEQVYFPRIRYDDDNGVVHEFELKVGYGRPPWSVGQKIDLLVNPENPDDVVVDSFMYKWFGPAVVCTVGLILLALVSTGWLVAVLHERKGRKGSVGKQVSVS